MEISPDLSCWSCSLFCFEKLSDRSDGSDNGDSDGSVLAVSAVNAVNANETPEIIYQRWRAAFETLSKLNLR